MVNSKKLKNKIEPFKETMLTIILIPYTILT